MPISVKIGATLLLIAVIMMGSHIPLSGWFSDDFAQVYLSVAGVAIVAGSLILGYWVIREIWKE